MSIWLTRPQRDSERMEVALAEHGIDSVIAPVMEIASLDVKLDGAPPDALILTSRRAAKALDAAPTAWRTLPVYCVGNATAQAAKRYHFNHTMSGEGSALDLLPLIAERQGNGDRLLHLSGDAVKIDLTPLLASRGITLERLVVYESHRVAALPPAFTHALHVGALKGVVFYSPRSVRFAAELAGDTLAKLDAYCLSMDIAAAAAKAGCRRAHACPIPTHQAMMELLFQHAMTAP